MSRREKTMSGRNKRSERERVMSEKRRQIKVLKRERMCVFV